MISIPLINRFIKSKPKPSGELQRLAKEIKEMSETKEWKDYLSQYETKSKNKKQKAGGSEKIL